MLISLLSALSLIQLSLGRAVRNARRDTGGELVLGPALTRRAWLLGAPSQPLPCTACTRESSSRGDRAREKVAAGVIVQQAARVRVNRKQIKQLRRN